MAWNAVPKKSLRKAFALDWCFESVSLVKSRRLGKKVLLKEHL